MAEVSRPAARPGATVEPVTPAAKPTPRSPVQVFGPLQAPERTVGAVSGQVPVAGRVTPGALGGAATGVRLGAPALATRLAPPRGGAGSPLPGEARWAGSGAAGVPARSGSAVTGLPGYRTLQPELASGVSVLPPAVYAASEAAGGATLAALVATDLPGFRTVAPRTGSGQVSLPGAITSASETGVVPTAMAGPQAGLPGPRRSEPRVSAGPAAVIDLPLVEAPAPRTTGAEPTATPTVVVGPRATPTSVVPTPRVAPAEPVATSAPAPVAPAPRVAPAAPTAVVPAPRVAPLPPAVSPAPGARQPEGPKVPTRPAPPVGATVSARKIGTIHTVVQGDTLYSLARRYGTTVTELARVNNLKDVRVIRLGAALLVPGGDLVVDDQVVQRDVAAVSEKGGVETMPFRFVVEGLGGHVSWMAPTQQATGEVPGKGVITITIGSNQAQVDEDKILMDLAAYLEHGRTMVPTRFITENMDVTIELDHESGNVFIRSNR